ncbi:MAG: AAA family ATPase [Rhizonema sp. NSF051]|nr:AAA family ATPase [Rhizonema sp. NSF051]
MPTIDEVIKQSFNPFDNFAARNFWKEQEPPPTVESIHQKQLTQIKSVLAEVVQHHQTRTIILYGDGGSGKTYFLGQLKQQLNNQAFFVYVEPFPQSDHIWRHILRDTVDSLVNAPEGQLDSQLILWLKSCLSTIRKGLKSDQQRLVDTIKSFFGKTDAVRDRQLFIDILKKTIGTTGIYNANEFFGILCDLTNPNLYSLACEWLKGDDLDEESLTKLRVKQSIDDEDKARGILGNFSILSAKTQPIVLCFDQLDSIARLADGSTIDLQALFNVNSAIYNGNWNSFLIIFSMRTETWNDDCKRVKPSDLDRADIRISLKRITLEEAEALLITRLYPLHSEANPKPNSRIYPLNQRVLEKAFPSRKAIPRTVLMLGKHLFQDYKEWLFQDKQPPVPRWIEGGTLPPPPPPPPDKIQAEFELMWRQEYQKVQGKIAKITLLTAPDLIRMLEQVLAALQVKGIKTKLITGKYASYSLSYQQPGKREQVGVVWTEDSNMKSFFSVMSACEKAINNHLCQSLQLIRATDLGKSSLAGYKIYQKIFIGTNHRHIKPTLSSVHYLATYHSLVNSVEAHELVIVGKTITLQELETLIRDSKILQHCLLLRELGIVSGSIKVPEPDKPDLQAVKDYLLNLVITQAFIGRAKLIQNTNGQFTEVDKSDLETIINQLRHENKINIVNPQAKLEDQTVCLVVKT